MPNRSPLVVSIVSLVSLGASAALAVGCGKSTKDAATTAEPKRADSAAPTSPAAPGIAASSTPAASPTAAPSRGPEHVAYSLVDNRLAAHVARGGGLVVPGGSAGFAKYVRFANTPKDKRAWQLRQTQGDIKVARISGKTASLF